MQLNKWALLILSVTLGNGCVEPYEPDIDESRNVIVIDGELTDTQGIQTISISRSSPYNNPHFRPVSGCVVRIEDNEGYGMTFLENESGIYQSYVEPGFLSVGNAYILRVITPDDEVYESEYDTLTACAPVDQLTYEVEEQETSEPDINYYGIRIYADIIGSPEDSRYYMWDFEETWEYTTTYRLQYMWDGSLLHDYIYQKAGVTVCYLTNRPTTIQVGSSSQLERNEIHKQPLLFVSNQTPRLQYRYSLLVDQHSLSKAAFLYWNKMKAQSFDTGGLYEAQPSNTSGNIYNINDAEEKVLGYFFVSQVQEKRITISEDFKFSIAPFNCPLDTAFNVKEFSINYPYFMFSVSSSGRGPPFAYSYKECHDCTYRGGVTTKPDYWDE